MGRKSIAEIRREEIIEAFFKVVSEKGFARATIREVANAAGCNHGMLHHYFSNKEEIIKAAVDHVMTVYTAELRDNLSRLDSAAEQIKFVIPWFFDLDRFDLEFSRAWMEFWVLSKNDPVVSGALLECYRELINIFSDIIRDGIKKGEFRKVNPNVAASVIMGNLEGATMLWVIDTEQTPVQAMGKQIEKMVTNYLFV